MYRFLLVLHSWDRWLVLFFAIAIVAVAIWKWARKEPWNALADRLGLFLVITADIQLLLGIALFAITPHMLAFFEAPAAVMRNDIARFWAVEHGFGMIIAIVLIHVGRISVRRAAEGRKPVRAFTYYGISLLIMLLTTPWPLEFLKYGRPLIRF